MDEVKCTTCGGLTSKLPSHPDYILLQCKIKKCGSVFDYGSRELYDELHIVYTSSGHEPEHGDL